MNPMLFILFALTIIAAETCEEILFRGVLHQGLRDRFEERNTSGRKWKSILLTSGIYTLYFFLFSFNVYFILFNFISSLVIGLAFEYSNRNLSSIVSLKITYTLIWLALLL
ncbi:MAG: CPBP family intramembrane metalloprotease [Candidatus Lokiarchaeota archaeon]|nr:CPBP family intramembrane metalloprotease [Candidatus Lokiarchaeota archaeon]